ncbi:uncharacterized protein YALI1_B01485g [Yarrowia lipolytica]|uniref:Uncharacterized protein n=1 Tax=Yarrowia lipolytica TaxID=4952 RepID=A0A1D8N5Y0_YARLL|nr:hypothetical protein YALI1_B01485g [Yarrowia lipolytica]
MVASWEMVTHPTPALRLVTEWNGPPDQISSVGPRRLTIIFWLLQLHHSLSTRSLPTRSPDTPSNHRSKTAAQFAHTCIFQGASFLPRYNRAALKLSG